MHNNIMAAGSKERPPMLGPGRYSQWHSRFLRYLDTKSEWGLSEEVLLTVIFTYERIIAAVRSREEHSTYNTARRCGKPLKGLQTGESLKRTRLIQTSLGGRKDMQKELGLLAKYNNDNQSRQFGNQRTVTVAGARETVGSPVVQKTGIQCFNCKGFGHYARECRKPKRVKDYAYHKEKMMMCKQAEQGVPLS
ncbi:retrovirus-related pol polyprotein from transposon TNT 1-94 [Tanacetum coccineum]